MEFIDDGVLLGARSHGENHAVADVFTAAHGRWSGLVYGGQGTKMRPVLQPGNRVRVSWKGRIADSLGHYSLELTEPIAASLLSDRFALSGLAAICATAVAVMPEREVHPGVYDALGIVLDHFDEPDVWPALLARWELGLLASSGFGLTLDKCAATGGTDELTFVSPKSAQAVCATAGEPYRDRMLPLPSFLRPGGDITAASREEVIEALTLTGYFLTTRVLHAANQTLPDARQRLVDLLNAPNA